MTSHAAQLFSARDLPRPSRLAVASAPSAPADFPAAQLAVASLERVVARVSASASTRACSLDLVRYARATPEPLARPAQGAAQLGAAEKNPWLSERLEDAGAQACCSVQ